MASAMRTMTAMVLALAVTMPTPVIAQAQLIEVGAQRLSAAIAELAAETGVQISADTRIMAGKTSNPVSGVMTPMQALNRILSGSNLAAVQSGNGNIVISQSASGDAIASGEDLIGEDIIVKGELITRTRQDSQTSVVVIRGEELEQRSEPEILTTIERTPGVTQASNQRIAIRGVPAFGFAAGRGTGTAVATIVDGAPLSSLPFFDGDPILSAWDLEQVEILRGPQSTQTGRNALFGAVRLESRDPSFEEEFKLRGEFGRFESLGGSFAANIPWEEQGLALRLSGDFQRTNGFIDNRTLNRDDTGEKEQKTLRAALLYEPTDDFSALFKYTYNESERGETFVDEAPFLSQRSTGVDAPNVIASSYNSFDLSLTYDINDEFSVVSKTNLLLTEGNSVQDVDGTPFPLATVLRANEGHSIQQEIRLEYEMDGVAAVLGGFYTNIEDRFLFDLPSFALKNDFTQTATNYAVFGEVEAEVLEDLKLIAGFRYDRENTTYDAITTMAGVPAFVNAEESYSAFLPKLGIVYDFTEDLSLGFTVQRGYRAGGIDIDFNGAADVFDPESTWNFEASLRSEWLDGALTVNANAFYTIWRDQQVIQAVQGGPPPFFINSDVTNAGKSRLFGGEIDITATPTESLELFASGAFVDTKFVDFNANGQILDGNRFNFAPRFSASAGATYTFDDGWFISTDVSYTGSTFADIQNTLKVDDRFLVNARAGYRSENFEMFAYARNLFDAEYITNRRPIGFAGATNTEPGEPLTFGVVGQVNF